MKFGVSFMFYCVTTILILSLVRDVESKEKRMCDFKKVYPGKCGINGVWTCFTNIMQLPNRPKNVPIRNFACSDIPNTPDRTCKYLYEC
ncbi:hypothetical protein CARUB_v10002991mg [Capsella rubella]|uniref:Uncharacterized protein n=1 Tax=Capsella rubella TaxID=81985 RepID=R0FIY0_9BRAS|nr:hypothetical protein CARUB_v10002991mg [Capsella rubella]